MLLLIKIVSSFVIQERSTMKYVANDAKGRINMVDRPEETTRYEIIPSVDKKLNIHIGIRKTKNVFDLGIDTINVLIANQSHNPSQLFQVNLDYEGYYQITQKDEIFLKYDSFMNGLIASRYKPNRNMGFLLYNDTGVFPYPVDINRGIESPYRKKPKMGNTSVVSSLVNGGVVGSSGYVTLNNAKFSSSKKFAEHGILNEKRNDAADIHAQMHNVGQKDPSFGKINTYNKHRQSDLTHNDLKDIQE